MKGTFLPNKPSISATSTKRSNPKVPLPLLRHEVRSLQPLPGIRPGGSNCVQEERQNARTGFRGVQGSC